MIWTCMLASLVAFAEPTKTTSDSTEENKKTDYAEEAAKTSKPYVFGWMDYSQSEVKLRGGSTTGIPVSLATEASTQWTSLKEDGLTALEQDRRAILAMTGDYRISFDFLEVEMYSDSTTPSDPYRSWATERVFVIENTEERISLQHIIVMFMQGEDGTTQGPMLVKHWRQDWEYEPETALEFIGERQWTTRTLTEDERKGRWQQTVYQVDDSPRYAMRGTWEHNAAYSSWLSEPAWRPLPRREYTVRSDYQTLVGTNRLTILPRGWIHAQDNVKTVLTGPYAVNKANPALAREYGVNRYDRIVGFDFSEQEAYWEKTAPFWSRVRAGWATHLSQAPTVKVATKCEDERVYKMLFGMASKIAEGKKMSARREAKKLESIFSCAVSPVP